MFYTYLMRLFDRLAKIPIWAKLLVNILILYALWLLFFKFLRNYWLVDYVYEEGIRYLTFIQLKAAQYLLELLGFKAHTLAKIIWIEGYAGVLLDRGCLGRNTLGLFIGFVLAFPSGLRRKWGIILIGTVVFIMLNILRITGLALTEYCCPKYLDINHHLIFKYIVYSAILLMWYLWLRWLRKQNEKAATD
jgi:exosortase/archaeosortase family protein